MFEFLKLELGMLSNCPHSKIFIVRTLKTPICTFVLEDAFRIGVVFAHDHYGYIENSNIYSCIRGNF